MMRLTLAVLLAAASAAVFGAPAPRLKVSDNGRFLAHEDGTPYFYLADTGWELFHKLGYNDAYLYLSNRAAKGFTAIQCVMLGEMNGLTDPNANGDLPFVDLDPARPNEKYFKHADDIVRLGTDMGLYMAILPTWGSWAVKEPHPLFPPIQFFNETTARSFGRFLGARYRSNPRIIWVLGGDRLPTGYEKLWTAMAEGLHEGDGGTHLITYHPRGGQSSSTFWHTAPWLNFNMLQTGHGTRAINSYDFIAHDYALQPPKPTLDAEPNYEDAPVGGPGNGLFDDHDIRRTSYWSVFAGGCGVAYGAGSIWQMNTGKNPVVWATRTWRQSLDLPGASQLKHLRALLESRPYFSRIPDQSLLVKDEERTLVPTDHVTTNHIQVTRDGTPGKNDATYVMAYLPIGRGFTLRTDVLAAKQLRVWWFDPRSGSAIPVGTRENKGTIGPEWNTMPWHNTPGPDWVFVVDDSSKQYPAPGSRPLF